MTILTTVDIRFASWEGEQAFLDIYQEMEREVSPQSKGVWSTGFIGGLTGSISFLWCGKTETP